MRLRHKRQSANRRNSTILFFFFLLVCSILGLGGVMWKVNLDGRNDKQYISNAGELRVLSQRIAKNASEAAAGKEAAFDLLKLSRDKFEELWNYLVLGNPETGLPRADDLLLDEINQLDQTWKTLKADADIILSSKEAVLVLHEFASAVGETVPQLQSSYSEVVEILLKNQASAEQVWVAQKQILLAERIVRSANKVLSDTDDAYLFADSFGRDANDFGKVLDANLYGNEAMQIAKVTNPEAAELLLDIKELFEFVNENVEQIVEASPKLFEVRGAASAIFLESEDLLDQASSLRASFELLAVNRAISLELGVGLGLMAVLCIICIGFLSYRNAQQDLKRTADENDQNQAAILRLLDELSNLADGDLSTAATVTEDFTGAIADSINYAIDQMRVLVTQINHSAIEVSQAAVETEGTAGNLADASENQAQEIAGASAAINEMAVSIDQVSSNASESANVAQRSVGIANNGAEVVQNTIHGMNMIREQIQETSKRIKRLGESSQEIGDIVSLINDITDQTNILALNAAIQASMAGDAGRGFAVVADEVQRLAERSSAATKQIEALVNMIQSDTNEAVISMEHTTAEVVRGAHLAQDAGVALEEIETVSRNLADLIQNISNAARQQSASAGHISNTMNVIQEITSQTASGSATTALSIGNLAQLAIEMRKSVSGFKLPADNQIDLPAQLAATLEEDILAQELAKAESEIIEQGIDAVSNDEELLEDTDEVAESTSFEDDAIAVPENETVESAFEEEDFESTEESETAVDEVAAVNEDMQDEDVVALDAQEEILEIDEETLHGEAEALDVTSTHQTNDLDESALSPDEDNFTEDDEKRS